MKKTFVFSIIVACVLLFTACTKDTIRFGDANSDNSVNVADVRAILQYAALKGSADVNTNFKDLSAAAADVNDDGVINAKDAAVLAIIIANTGADT